MKKIAMIISVIATAMLFNFTDASAQFVVRVRPVAPVVIRERPPMPRPNLFWIDGFWRWHPRRREYIWVDGYWERPRHGRVWIPGFWRDVPEGSIWIEGYWGRR